MSDREDELPPKHGAVRKLEEAPAGVVGRRHLIAAATASGAAVYAAGESTALGDTEGSVSYVTCSGASNAPIVELGFSPDGLLLAVLSDNGRLRVWSTAQPKEPLGVKPSGQYRAFAWGEDGLLVALTRRGTLHAFLPATSTKQEWEAAAKDAVAVAARKGAVAWLSKSGHLEELDAKKGRSLRKAELADDLARLGLAESLKKKRPLVFDFVTGDPDAVGILHEEGTLTRYKWGASLQGVLTGASSGRWHASRGFTRHAWLDSGAGVLKVLDVPGGARGFRATIPAGAEVMAVAPDLGSYAYWVNGQVGLASLVTAGPPANLVTLESGGARVFAAAPGGSKLAWGNAAGQLFLAAMSPSGSTKQRLFDPKIAKVKTLKPDQVPRKSDEEADGCLCTCNSVSVSRGSSYGVRQVWDSVHERWITESQPCGTPLPKNAICTCNCVSVPASLWHLVCTCDTVCTCNSQGGTWLTYWY